MIEHTVDTGGTLAPQRETARILSAAKSLIIKAGGKTYSGAMTMTIDDEQNVVIDCKAAAKKAPVVVKVLKKKGKK